EPSAERRKPLLCHRCQQRGLVLEVVVGRSRRHARPARQLSEGEGPQLAFGDQRERGIYQRPPEISVVVPALGPAGSLSREGHGGLPENSTGAPSERARSERRLVQT